MDPATTPCFILAPEDGAVGLYSDISVPGGPNGDSGVDLRFAADEVILPDATRGGYPVVIDLQVRCRCETGNRYGPYLIVPRSSIGRTPLILANSVGTIDRGYIGRLKVSVHNLSLAPYEVKRGDSLFQLVSPGFAPAVVSVTPAGHPAFGPGSTSRGEGAFGSTGSGGTGSGGILKS